MKFIHLAILCFSLIPGLSSGMSQDTSRFNGFGRIIIYRPSVKPDAFIVFISGGDGWTKGVSGIAQQLSSKGAMVVGVDLRTYQEKVRKLNKKCYYPAGDIEEMSMSLQKTYKMTSYLKPILLGYAAGSTTAYGALAQAPSNTFRGSIAIGFNPVLEFATPLCNGSGLDLHPKVSGKSWYLSPCGNLSAPFYIIAGQQDKKSTYPELTSYIKSVKNGQLLSYNGNSQDISRSKDWMPQLFSAIDKIKMSNLLIDIGSEDPLNQAVQQPGKFESNLPLVLMPCQKKNALPLVIFLSGDGGWTSFDQSVSAQLVAKGLPVLGIDSQKYFWQARTPNETSAEINKAISYYLNAYGKKTFIICGYSFGADIVPYLLTRLTPELKPLFSSAVMMSPDPKADFEIHVADMLSFGSSSDKYDVLAELRKSVGVKITCLFGKEEDGNSQILFKNAGARLRQLPGNHHYNNDYNAISNEIINSVN